MSTTYDLPMPGDGYDGRTVVASCFVADEVSDPYGDSHAAVLLLNAEPPFYAVASIEWSGGSWANTDEETFANIVLAGEHYHDVTGCA